MATLGARVPRPGSGQAQMEPVHPRQADGASPSIDVGGHMTGRLPVRSTDWLRLQSTAGNRAIATAMRARSVQRDEPTPAKAAPSDEGGAADVTNLEQDMRDILQQWQDGAKDGVSQFVTNTLSSRLDDIESGSWTSFISGLIGNTLWAATIFLPVGMTVAAFRISMAGIAIAAYPTIPKKSKSGIPELQKQVVDYVNDVYAQLNGQLRGKSATLLQEHPKITRYQALAEFLRNSFQRDFYMIDPTNRTVPMLNKSAIRDRFVRLATERLELANLIEYKKLEGDLPSAETAVVSEVAWIRGPQGKPRLAILTTSFSADTRYDAIPADADRSLKRWVGADHVDAAVNQWMAQRNYPPATYDAAKIYGLSG